MKGIENIKDAPSRLDAAKQAFNAMTAELKAYYPMMGQYDAVVISEGPDDLTAAKLAFAIGSPGTICTGALSTVFRRKKYIYHLKNGNLHHYLRVYNKIKIFSKWGDDIEEISNIVIIALVIK